MPCSLPCHGSSSGVPDGNKGDKGGEKGFSDDIAKVHHCHLWQVELLQLPQKVYPHVFFFFIILLLFMFCEGADVQLHNANWGVTLVNGATWGWAPLVLKLNGVAVGTSGVQGVRDMFFQCHVQSLVRQQADESLADGIAFSHQGLGQWCGMQSFSPQIVSWCRLKLWGMQP